MIPWKLLSSTRTPDTKNELKLYQRDGEYSIRVLSLSRQWLHGIRTCWEY